MDRPQVTITWGQGVNKLAKVPQPANKAVPIIGKMPWLKRGGSAEYGSGDTGGGAGGRVSKFGPPITAGVNMAIPPPTLVTQVPTLGTSSPAIAVPLPPGMAPPSAPPPKPRIDRNPSPQSGDMNAMLAAAQRHMQQRFSGVPPPPASEPDSAETIPLPADMPALPHTGTYQAISSSPYALPLAFSWCHD